MAVLRSIKEPHMKFLSNPKVAWSVSGSGIALTLGMVVVGYLLGTYGYGGAIRAWYLPLTNVLTALVAMLVGGIIATRSPYIVYGWMWILIGFSFGAMQPLFGLVAKLALSSFPERTFLGGIAVYLTSLFWLLSISMLAFVVLLYPTGDLPSPRWRWYPWVILLAASLTGLVVWAVPGPSGIAPVNNPFGQPGIIGKAAQFLTSGAVNILFVMFPVCAVSLVLRYRQAKGLQRAQLRWLAFTTAINLAFMIIDMTGLDATWLTEEIRTMISDILLATLPVSVAVAMLRYRLYDIDLIIRRTLQYGLLSVLLGSVYFGMVVLLEQIFRAVTGQGSPLVVVLSTLAIVVLFNPLRHRIQAVIDRRFYRQKYDTAQALAEFSSAARQEVALERLTGSLVGLVEQTIQPEAIWLWIL